MQTAGEWQASGNGWKFGDARAEQLGDPATSPCAPDPVFVISTFGAGADADLALSQIRAAMVFDRPIAIRRTEETEPIVRQLIDAKQIRCAPHIGLGFDAFGVVGIKRA